MGLSCFLTGYRLSLIPDGLEFFPFAAVFKPLDLIRDEIFPYGYGKNGIPSHDTMQRVFAIIRPDELQGMLKEILVQMIEMAGQHLDPAQ